MDILINKEKYNATISVDVEQDNGIIYTEIWNFKNKSLKNLANHIGKKYIEFFERKYEDVISSSKNMNIKISDLQIDGMEVDKSSVVNLKANIVTDVGIKELNQKFNCDLNKIHTKDLAKELIKLIEFYAYECDTDMNAIQIIIKKLNIMKKKHQ